MKIKIILAVSAILSHFNCSPNACAFSTSEKGYFILGPADEDQDACVCRIHVLEIELLYILKSTNITRFIYEPLFFIIIHVLGILHKDRMTPVFDIRGVIPYI